VKLQKMLVLVIAIFLLTASAMTTCAQTDKTAQLYKNMSRNERLVFVGEQARRIARDMSGTEYEFTPAFEEDILKAVTYYAERVGVPEKADLRLVLERGQTQAPLLIAAFRARNVSPIYGLYIPWIESEYKNIQPSDSKSAIGMFQFLPATGENLGLMPQELLDVNRSADAAARYIAASLVTFKDDPMKEALALLAYNRGTQQTLRDLQILANEQNKGCSICALTADRSKRDETFTYENALYVPRFFAAAIIGENPRTFGVQMQPLSSQ